MEFQIEETYSKQDFAGLVAAVQYRMDRRRRGKLLLKLIKAVLGIWALAAGISGFAMLLKDGTEILGADAGTAGAMTVVLPCLVLSVCGVYLLLSLRRTPLGAGAAWRSYPEKGKLLTYRATEDGVICQSEGSRLNFAYSLVQCVLEDRERFYLFVDQRAAHMLRKDGFVQGAPEEFRAFITQKTGQPVEMIK